jgi:hypothetical protein
LEVYGLEGILLVNRPDEALPPVEVYRLDAAPGAAGWVTPRMYEIFSVGSDRFAQLQHAVQIEYLAGCLPDGRQPVASGRYARLVLEVMLAAERSAAKGRVIDVASTF